MYFNTDNRMHSVLQYSAIEVGPCEHDKSGALLCGRPARAQFGPPWCLGGIGAPLVCGTKLVTEKHLQVKLETENTSGSGNRSAALKYYVIGLLLHASGCGTGEARYVFASLAHRPTRDWIARIADGWF